MIKARSGKPRLRGEPIVMLAALLAAYVGLRAANWESPLQIVPALTKPFPRMLSEHDTPHEAAGGFAEMTINQLGASSFDLVSASLLTSEPNKVRRMATSVRVLAPTAQPPVPSHLPQQIGFGPTSMLMAGLGQAPASDRETSQISAPTDERSPGLQHASRRERWSMDGWLFFRQGQPAIAINGAQPASYGASQAGAVLRYRLSPGDARRPTAYVRAARTIGSARGSASESEAALGMSARPFAGLPMSAHAEVRIRETGGQTEVRPAVFVVSELPATELPLAALGEAYVQAGYVGGEFDTGFADGQARITREMASFRLGKVRAGAGVWGGAQKGAARLDVGPSASVDFRIGPTNGRAQLDYRMKVAGDAEPGDGIAFTLSTGF